MPRASCVGLHHGPITVRFPSAELENTFLIPGIVIELPKESITAVALNLSANLA